MTLRSLSSCLLLAVVTIGVTTGASVVMAEPEGGYVADPVGGDYESERRSSVRGNTSKMDMLIRLDRLQQEQQQLLGKLEEQNYLIEGLKRRQRELYLDVDRRLTRLEKEDGAGTGSYTSEPTGSADKGCQSIAPGGCVVSPATPQAGQDAATQPVTVQAGSSARERTSYQQAFNFLRELRYEQASAAFRDFLKVYPAGVYAHMAQYWLGEANYTQRLFPQAIIDYQQLIEHYPQSPKLAEAMLKIGYSQDELGDKAAAMETLIALEKRFPGSTEAGQARKLLLRLRSEQ